MSEMVDGNVLPDDVLRAVFSLLTSKEQCRLGVVCRSWCQIADEVTASVHLRLSPTDSLSIQARSFPQWLGRQTCRLECLKLHGGNSRSLSPALLGVVETCRMLTYLDLRHMQVGLSKADCRKLPAKLQYLSTKLATPLHVDWPLGHLADLRVVLLEITDRSLDARRPTMEVTRDIAVHTALQTLVLDGEVTVTAHAADLEKLVSLSSLGIHGHISERSLFKFGACPGLARLLLLCSRRAPRTTPALPGVARLLLASPHNMAVGLPDFSAFPHLRQLMASSYHIGGPVLHGLGHLPHLREAIVACNQAHITDPLPPRLTRIQLRNWAPEMVVSTQAFAGMCELSLVSLAARASVTIEGDEESASLLPPRCVWMANPDVAGCSELLQHMHLQVAAKCPESMRFATDDSWFTNLDTVCKLGAWWETLWPSVEGPSPEGSLGTV